MNTYVRSLAMILPILAISVGAIEAQDGRTTDHLVTGLEEEISTVTLPTSGGFTYFTAGKDMALCTKAPDNPWGSIYRDNHFIGILSVPGSDTCIALAADPDALRAYEIDPVQGTIDENQPLWSRPPVDYREACDFANQPNSSFIVIEDIEAKKFDVVNFQNGEVVWSIDRGRTEISGCASHLVASPDGNKVFIGQMFFPPSSDGAMYLVHSANSDSVVRRSTVNQAIVGVSFSPDGSLIAYQASHVANARFDPSTPAKVHIVNGNDLTDILTLSDNFTSLRRIGFSPDGTKLGVLTGPDFRVYDVATGLRLDFIPIPNDDGLSFDFNADGTKVAIGTQAGKLDLIDLILVPPMTEPTETQQ